MSSFRGPSTLCSKLSLSFLSQALGGRWAGSERPYVHIEAIVQRMSPKDRSCGRLKKYTRTKFQGYRLCFLSSNNAIKFIESGRKKKHSHDFGLGPSRISRIMRKVSTFQSLAM